MRLPADKLAKLPCILKWFEGQRKVTEKKNVTVRRALSALF